ncbi:hypothetical protein M406DRAFT_70236 [Cryphonectria parasitica EP155]|uniref:Uncharacterized protein n=1 Tax=Cryphonectria parasitica (strain ATCC 38755 / EP155) TaxID=660469 RepID=A0A9P4Y745_CRYP1|nr:uncharacterized protein M406DRAFT_70236 [Cryphonectria parasitica EP155]KAF3768142.1 hypothetical protein M406DRAFT_70236 [Cryphonectria parasitica EP155]
MSFNNCDAGSSEPPPSYAACVGNLGDVADFPPEKQHMNEDLLEDSIDLASNAHPPPPFSITPGSLVLAPQTVTIRPPISGARPLYQLSKPLGNNAVAPCLSLFEVPATRQLEENGTLKTVDMSDGIYHIREAEMALRKQERAVVISGQRHDQFSGVQLRKETSMGITGMKNTFDVISDDETNHPRLLYHARFKKGILEWHDGGGELIAIETPSADKTLAEERLDIVVSMDKPHLDLMVALWVARVWQDTEESGLKEDTKEAKKRKTLKREPVKQEGKHYGILHGMKEALKIGHESGFEPDRMHY